MKAMQQLTLFAVLLGVTSSVRIVTRNNFSWTIWVGSQGNPGFPALDGGGWILPPGAEKAVNVEGTYGGRLWARTGCNDAQGRCETGDCGRGLKCNGAGGKPPVSLVEFKMKDFQNLDFYDISFVDGFNIKVSMESTTNRNTENQPYKCIKAKCDVNINDRCPNELRQIISGRTVACYSACEKFQTDEYCCRGAHDKPETCKSRDWPRDYPQQVFKSNCPDAYSYAYDDHKATFTCSNTDYLIVFG